MGVIEGYIPYRPLSGLGALGEDLVAAPPGVRAPSSLDWNVIGDISQQLGLQEIGIYTPWAGREGMDWIEVRQPPSTNIVLSGLNDQQLQAAMAVTFGQPLGWIAVLADRAGEEGQLVAALEGTPYEFFQTQAIFSQNDAGEPPRIRFLHWARIRDPGDQDSGSGSLDGAAHAMGGTLVFAMQVNSSTTTSRPAPTISFADALAAQFGSAPVPVGPGPMLPGPTLPGPDLPMPQAPAPASGSVWLPVLGAGVVCAVLGFVLTRAVQKRRR